MNLHHTRASSVAADLLGGPNTGALATLLQVPLVLGMMRGITMSTVFPTESLASCSGIWVKVTIFSELALERSDRHEDAQLHDLVPVTERPIDHQHDNDYVPDEYEDEYESTPNFGMVKSFVI